VKAPVAVSGRYQRIPLAGPVKDFDLLLDSWLSRAVELGMVGSGLGEVFLVPMGRKKKEGVVAADNLLLVGMGEPGHFGTDDLRYLLSNVTVAVKAMGHEHCSTSLIGARRAELPVDRAVRGMLEGVVDGFERFRGMLAGVTKDAERFRRAAEKTLIISLVEADEPKVEAVLQSLARIEQEPIPGLVLDYGRGEDVPGPALPEQPAPTDLDPREKTTLLRVAHQTAACPAPGAGEPAPAAACAGSSVYQFAALGESAAITVREVAVQTFFVRQLPGRLTNARGRAEQEAFGLFLTNFLIPEEFRPLIQGGNQLTLVLDAGTACYPWEMAAFRGRHNTCFFGTDLRLSRQFRTLLSAAPGVAPPLNQTLKVLVIADPAQGLPLPGARAEGEAVVEVLKQAQRDWGKVFQLQATVRIGPYAERAALRRRLDELRGDGAVVRSAEACDPFELLMLMVDEEYDVVHYSGHGVFDPGGGRMGWVFDKDCVLTAQEIFRVRQVPRLVFANACLSAVTRDDHATQQQHQVGLAQAFFARGIHNYIGTGWAVDDEPAKQLAVRFYRQALGQPIPTAPPATIGQSLAEARRALLNAGLPSSTWGAYQHYGRATDKLLPLPNANGAVDG
jgi:hypothetical protein